MDRVQFDRVLCLKQASVGMNAYTIDIALESPTMAPQRVRARFSFALTAEQQEAIRWYFEDAASYPIDPVPEIAARVEAQITTIGTELFRAVFMADDDARDLWANVRPHLQETRVEVVTDVDGAASIPWELLRDPKGGTPLVLGARSFVRGYDQAAVRPQLPDGDAVPLRILLVISRLLGLADVPYRSVARLLIKSIRAANSDRVHLEVLRPPTFERLSEVLQCARDAGTPFHVVHFDGHGGYADIGREDVTESLAGGRGTHGYLLFEDPDGSYGMRPVDGTTLGRLLVKTSVPVLILNACRTAYSEGAGPAQNEAQNVHAQVRSSGSLAQEVMDAGVAGVVAMRYHARVQSVAQFIADLYNALTQGLSLGEAVSRGRNQMEARSPRLAPALQTTLQDWSVPVVYEAVPFRLFSTPGASEQGLTLDLAAPTWADSLEFQLSATLTDFVGRDDVLLLLDRAFDANSVVLLSGYAGSGKTSTAIEFARWYKMTGGVTGPVVPTSFRPPKSLQEVLEALFAEFRPLLNRTGEDADRWDDAKRRQMALTLLERFPVLWIWDNVEQVGGFPSAADAQIPANGQQELAEFLRAASRSRSRFLLVSRREEQEWLGDLPNVVRMPPMPMADRLQLCLTLAKKRGLRLPAAEAWQPLLEYSQGNPLMIHAMVSQILRNHLTERTQIEAYVQGLRSQEPLSAGGDGIKGPLMASLQYGFAHDFTPAEQKQLSLLSFFERFLDANALVFMVEHLRELSHGDAVAALSAEEAGALLERAEGVGLVSWGGEGLFSIHPALPIFFREHFHRFFPRTAKPVQRAPAAMAAEAFVVATAAMCRFYLKMHESGHQEAVVKVLALEEQNLVSAFRTAMTGGPVAEAGVVFEALQILYNMVGRYRDAGGLRKEMEARAIDQESGDPRPGFEDQWLQLLAHRARQAIGERNLWKARALLTRKYTWLDDWLDEHTDDQGRLSSDEQRQYAAEFISTMVELADVNCREGSPAAFSLLQDAALFADRWHFPKFRSRILYQLGEAYSDVPVRRNLDLARMCFEDALKYLPEPDSFWRARCLMRLSEAALDQYDEAAESDPVPDEAAEHLRKAEAASLEALAVIPAELLPELSFLHDLIGRIYARKNDVTQALAHMNQSIQLKEQMGRAYRAGLTRHNAAVLLFKAGRLEEALLYAKAALADFADEDEDRKQRMARFVAVLEERLKESTDMQ